MFLFQAHKLLVIRSVDKYYLDSSHVMNKDHEDPWVGDYSLLSVPVIKLVLRSKLPLIHEKTKVHIIRNWVARNGFLPHQAAIFDMLRCIDLREIIGSSKEVTALVSHLTMVGSLTTVSTPGCAVVDLEASERRIVLTLLV